MDFKNYYEILGVAPTASQDEIRRAYRRLARQHHPDVSSEAGAEGRFKDASEAYEVLKDPEKRAAFDQVRAQPNAGRRNWQPPPGWKPDGGDMGSGSSGFSDFFETLFGGRSRSGGFGYSARGDDHRAAVTIDLETAHAGGVRPLMLQTQTSGGTRPRKINVRLPAGVTEGEQIRLRGQGGAGRGGAPSGDIVLEVDIAPHPHFRLEGRDVHYTLPVAPWEAALGAKVTVPTLDGPVELSIPAGSQSGKRLRLKGRGLGRKQRGQQYVLLHIVTPPADTDAAKQAYQRMAEELAFDPRSEA